MKKKEAQITPREAQVTPREVSFHWPKDNHSLCKCIER